MSEPTPGPWEANLESDHGDYVIWGPSPNDEFIANIGTSVDEAMESDGAIIAFDVAKANARLIAAAPDLLAACKAALSWDAEDEFGNSVDEEFTTPAFKAYRQQLRAAIAKAQPPALSGREGKA